MEEIVFHKLDEAIQKLITLAEEAKNYSYSPYSHFRVGAAILTKSGRVHTGCNIENIAFSPTVCAERTALFKAISEGDNQPVAVAVCTDDDEPSSPCGVCRQVINEFADGNAVFYLKGKGDKVVITSINELLPLSFRPKSSSIGSKEFSD